jgi:outer membrane receptor protein involved in Fe transport
VLSYKHSDKPKGIVTLIRNSLLKYKSAVALLMVTIVPDGEAQTSTPLLEEVVVSATLMRSDTNRVSASSLDNADMMLRGAAHFEDLLTAVTNVSASAGASRQRFFQIRGIGERSQFIEPINPSVVILQDGVDISGLGAALTTFDTAQIDVLRGPQGSLMGAGALAGLINVTTSTPTNKTEAFMGFGIEGYGGRRANVIANTGLTDTLSVRLAHQRYKSDGWIDNTFLGVSNTNHRDERTSRFSMRHDYGTDIIDVGVTRLDIDNGYDGFSLDNTRQTLSDEPGEDSLKLTSAFLRWRHRGEAMDSQLQFSSIDADSLYSYDEDWSFVSIRPFWEYSSFDAYERDIERTTVEWRLSPSVAANLDWVVGLYGREDSETLGRDYTYLASPFDSSNDTDTWAAFGQFSTPVSSTITATIGGRVERREVDYRDSAEVSEKFSDQYWTGNASLEWQMSTQQSVYATLARGVRAGGVNASLSSTLLALANEIDVTLYASRTRFNEEVVLNRELGWRLHSTDGRLRAALAVFSMDRDDQQVKGSLVIPRADGSTSFTDFTDNAATGTNRGLEFTVDWLPSESLTLNLAIGRLDAEFDEYINIDGTRLSGRDQPQAPAWQYRANASWRLSAKLTASLEATGRDAFYLSDRHDVQSPNADMLNANVLWENGNWSLNVWGRNLTDELTVTRGFGTFGNDPRKDYALEPYYQFGEPRTVGATISYRFGE